MPIVKRKVDVNIYDSNLFTKGVKDFRKETPKKSSTEEISMLELIYSTAKSILTNVPMYTPNAMAFARAYFSTIPFLLTDKDGYWVIDYANKDVLRDFSKTTRIGELAQGINYALCFKVLGAVSVYDFKDFIQNEKGIRKAIKGKTPDYVIQYRNGEYGLIESKGTTAADPTPFIYSGKQQINAGDQIFTDEGIPLKDSYSSAVSFATSSGRMKRYTRVYMADPNGDEKEAEPADYRRAVLNECAKHLCIAGQLNLANMCIRSDNILKECMSHCRYEGYQTGRLEWINEEGREAEIEFGFSKELVQYLLDDWKCVPEFAARTDEAGKCEYFADGTYVKAITRRE